MYRPAAPSTPAEVQEKAEHDEDESSCHWPHPEHDYRMVYEDENGVQDECARCGAECWTDRTEEEA